MEERSNNPLFDKCCIIGLGLMGGSLGISMKRYGVARECWGFDQNMSAMQEARSRGAVDRAEDLEQALDSADLVVLALPIRQTIEMLKKIGPHLRAGAVVTDVGSTKESIVQAMETYLPTGISAVGGHPMAGSEKTGIEAADPLLLENAVYLLTPASNVSRDVVEKMEQMVYAMKAYPVVLQAESHDHLVALVSHLPHLLAVALVNTLRCSPGERELLPALAGGGFRDTTRIAMGDASLWYDIFSTNSRSLKEALQAFQVQVDQLWSLLENEQEQEARDELEQARKYRRALPYRGKGLMPEVFELIIMLPDVPGVIGKVATLVGEAGLNISEVEMLKNRENEGGSIRLGFGRLAERDEALLVLEEAGYRCWKRG